MIEAPNESSHSLAAALQTQELTFPPRLALSPTPSLLKDLAIETVSSICMFFFILELILNSWSKTTFKSCYPKLEYDGYLFTFYWWLDLIAIISMWFDISWIADPMGVGSIASSVSGANNLAKAGRVVRLVRLVRLVKLFKIANERKKRKRQDRDLMELVSIGALSYEDVEKQRALNNERSSKLGSELSESTTKRVIVIVLVMVCVLPLLTSPSGNYAPTYAIQLLQKFQMDSSITSEAAAAAYSELSDALHSRDGENYLIYLDVIKAGTTVASIRDYDKLGKIRNSASYDEDLVTYSNGIKYEIISKFSLRPLEYESAMYSVLMTIFIGGLLVVGSVVFVEDTERLVLKPIGRMMNMVEEVARDPLATLVLGDNGGEYETRLLETTIEKITGLLRVGFGEAGAGIISANLSADSSGSSAINPLLPGVRVYAIVGFCDIHQFEFVNQQLAADILQFVNTIAEIVHSRVHYWGGQCNKNLGNAFVIIWRIGDEETIKSQIMGFSRKSLKADSVSSAPSPSSATSTPNSRQSSKKIFANGGEGIGKNKNNTIDLRRVPGVDVLADKALIGYLKIIAEINRSPGVLKYRNEPRLTHGGQHDFTVRMGFGLHAGWAIEGAVGSLQKVDATYLSPHVNMAARLETSSRQYGVPILISHFTHELFSNDVQLLCRRVDVCTVKGSEVPIGVFTYDCLQEQIFIQKTHRGSTEEWVPEDGIEVIKRKRKTKEVKMPNESSKAIVNRARVEENENIEEINTESDGDHPIFAKANQDSSDIFDNDVDLIALKNHVTEECKCFRPLFNVISYPHDFDCLSHFALFPTLSHGHIHRGRESVCGG